MMFPQSFTASALLISSLFLSSTTSATPLHRHNAFLQRRSEMLDSGRGAGHVLARAGPSTPRKRAARRCTRKTSSSTLSSTSHTSTKTTAPADVGGRPTFSSTLTEETKTKTKTAATHTSSSPPSKVKSQKPAGVKPAGWPQHTQSTDVWIPSVATASDPYLKSVSDALNNDNNPLFTKEHTGDLTYYGQGLGACGDTYDDASYTAAVSWKLFDAWPGANGQQNRNGICGPFVPGRRIINDQGTFTEVIKSSLGSILIGGDGLPNCDAVPSHQCHIPLTATVTNPDTGKSVIVKIVDRCAGCAGDADIDMTPTAFAAIADPALGRVHGVKWKFNDF